ncbi:hypothetical protein [Breoghania sp.]|uniref:DUF7933 domain-containing protein n=1 Tax=Breoghania sp. TaxID=2065378 RepID=UPI00262B5E6F|nr:hypothetical protein [Breoghania sp.]MDJ0931101.1 hypothetical protein [Breoghania sp.]
MAFSPSSVGIGAASTLTYTITNPTATIVTSVAFTNTLPSGLEVASPSSLTTDCTGATATATSGSQTVQLAGGFSTAAGSCTVTVDITNTSAGTYVNSANLTSSQGTSGTATDTLTVTGPTGDLTLVKQFNRTLAAPGSSIDLTNTDTGTGATSITFTDNLDGALSGLTVSSLPADGFCGSGA